MVRIYEKKNAFMVEIRFRWPEDRSVYRQRLRSPVATKSGAQRWGEARERELLLKGKAALTPSPDKKEVPTLKEFGPRFIKEYAHAERHKPSGIDSKETILRLHLVPALGSKRLNEITNSDVQNVKNATVRLSPKSTNNVLVVLGRLLRFAVETGEIAAMPCRVKLLKSPGAPARPFYDFVTYARLVEAAGQVSERALLVVLLAGDAGLRRGEIIGLRWSDVDFQRREITVAQSIWHGEANAPKSNKPRTIDMTDALFAALRAHRHLRGERVLYTREGHPPSVEAIRGWVAAAERRADLAKTTGAVHVLRHTFCSHLAMRGAPAKAIQDLAGHANLSTTQRYMHLSPGVRRDAIALLNGRGNDGASQALSAADAV